MQKKGQVTAFIVIGLVILILAVGVIAVKQGYLNKALEKLGLIRTTPEQVDPVQDFLESCVKRITTEAVDLVGLQGGYVNLPEDPIPNSQFTPINENLEIIPDSNLKTALWFRERGNGIQVLEIPSKQKIETELEDYVNVNFPVCLNNLSYFTQEGYLLQGSGTPKTEATITDNKVRVSVDFPLTVSRQNAEFGLEKHSIEIESNLGELHSLATQIMQAQYEQTFLENKTLNMLVAYDSEVPYSGIDIGCGEKIWSKPETILKLKNILHENIAVTTIKNTNIDLKQELEYLQFDALKGTHNDVNVNLMYIPNWPTLVEINPSEGNILRGNSITRSSGVASSLISSFVCLGDHRFIYDIKYPVLITLKDKDGFIFQFATEVIIDNNQPRINTLEVPQIPDIENPICQYPQKDLLIATATYNNEGELIPLTDVNLNFKCSPASCPLGQSSQNYNEPTLKAKVPLCVNGIVEGRKPGYFTGKSLFSSNQETNDEVLVALEPIYTKKVNVKVIDKNTGEVRDPYESEQISFQFNHDQNLYLINYIYPDQNEIQLIIGDYNIDSYLIREPTWPVTTQKQEIENCVDTRDPGFLGLFKSTQHCEKAEIPSMELSHVLTGGAKFTHSFTREELASEKELTLYILSDDLPGDLESMQKIQIAVEVNKDHPLFREPEI